MSIYDKFIEEGGDPSLLRRALNPVARFLFSDLTLRLNPLLERTGLEVVTDRESPLDGLYTIAQAHPAEEGTANISSRARGAPHRRP